MGARAQMWMRKFRQTTSAMAIAGAVIYAAGCLVMLAVIDLQSTASFHAEKTAWTPQRAQALTRYLKTHAQEVLGAKDQNLNPTTQNVEAGLDRTPQ